MTLGFCLSLWISVGGAGMDLLWGKVFNSWILLGWCAGLGVQVYHHGISGLIPCAGGALLPVLLLFPLFYFRMMGAGDIKLLSALGGILGPWGILTVIFWALCAGGVLSAAFLVSSGNIRERFSYLKAYSIRFLQTGKAEPYYKKGARPENLHFAVPVFLGILMCAGGY